MIDKKNLHIKVLVICWLPLLLIVTDIFLDHLGANPIRALHIRLGDWSLRFLWLTLAITPIQAITGWRGMSDYRRLFGLFCFTYASLHLFVYLVMDQALQWQIIYQDILESTYIWFGISAYIIIFLLAITTPNRSKKIMGKNWKKLHRFIYLASVLAILHYFLQLKGNLALPFLYALILFILLSFRLILVFKTRQLSKLMLPKGRR